MSKYDKVHQILCEEVPGLKVVEKSSSRFMRFLSWLPPMVFFRKKFLNDYFTTIGPVIYWPGLEGGFQTLDEAAILAHEGQHAWDGRRLTWGLYGIGYLFPQVLAVLALLAVLSIWLSSWWLVSLVALGALGPWPAPWRAHFEARACAAGAVVMEAHFDHIPEGWEAWAIKKIFLSWLYWRPCWRRKAAERILDRAIRETSSLMLRRVEMAIKEVR